MNINQSGNIIKFSGLNSSNMRTSQSALRNQGLSDDVFEKEVKEVNEDREVVMDNDLRYINLRDEFCKKLEPKSLKSNISCWNLRLFI